MFLALILAALSYRITEGFMSTNICKGSFSQLWKEEVIIMVCGFFLKSHEALKYSFGLE